MNKTAKIKNFCRLGISLRNSKRGVSPLIATILLLIFAIGLGVILMNWGRAQVEAASKCAVNIGIDVIELNNIPEVCYAGSGEEGYIHFIIENGPNIDVKALHIRVIGKKGVYNAEIIETIPMGYSLLKDLPYNFDKFGEIRQIKISPKVILYEGEEPILCPEQAVVLGNIRSC
ncbi:hypothetical protein GOV06_01830 [Candidatus Woesearchaeota archaeon]|nr:hypothetical protein [Candidatus Woesearchaeota archaeon]